MDNLKRLIIATLSGVIFLVPLVGSAQVAPLANSSPAPDTSMLLCYDFSRNLHKGSTGEAVRMLQYFLITKEQANIDSSAYGTFDASTVVAVNAFQTKYPEILAKLPHQMQTGTVGFFTRAKLKALYGCQNPASSAPIDYSGINLSVTNITLDNIGVTASFCNNGANNIPTSPFRIRLNGVNRDFDIVGTHVAGACDTETLPYTSWGLTYDPTVTYTAIALIDPNNTYRKSSLQFPTNGTVTLNSYAITGAHLSVRSIILKSTGVQATFCNLGTTNVTSFPVRVTLNGTAKDYDIAGAYIAGKCAPMTWPYTNWNVTYTPGTVYTVNVQVDPNNVIQEINEFDNSATVVGAP